MWPRVCELMLGCWLAASPLVFGHGSQRAWWINDLACGGLVVVLATASFWPPLRRAHLAELGVAVWLVGFGYFAEGYPAPPALQNHIVVGLVLMMFAIVPSEATLPPPSWRAPSGATPEDESDVGPMTR